MNAAHKSSVTKKPDVADCTFTVHEARCSRLFYFPALRDGVMSDCTSGAGQQTEARGSVSQITH